MSQLKLFLITAMFLLALPSAFSVSAGQPTINQSFNSAQSSSSNFTLSGCTINSGGNERLNCIPNAANNWAFFIQSIGNVSTNSLPFMIEIQEHNTTAANTVQRVSLWAKSSNNSAFVGTNEFNLRGNGADGINIQIWDRSGTTSEFTIAKMTSDGTLHNLRIAILQNMSLNISVNHTQFQNFPLTNFGANLSFLQFFSDANTQISMRQLIVINGTSTPISADTTFPLINLSINNTSPKINDVINISFNVSDETGLSTINITTNGTDNRKINYTVSGANAILSNATKINLTRGNVINITIWATDTSNNVAQNSTLVTVADTPPTFTLAINNTSPKINEFVNFSALVNDADIISTIIASWNCSASGIWINISNTTISSSSFNYTIGNQIVGGGRGNTCGWLFYSNDSVSAFTASTVSTFVVADTLGSISIDINNTSPKINEVINISGNATDADGDMAFGWVVVNQTGVNVNYTFAGSGTRFNFSQNITIGVGKGNVINFSVFYNDTAGTIYQNSTLITIANTIPNATNFVNATGRHYTGNVTRLNWTASTDGGEETLRYIVFSDASNPPTALYYNGTDLNLTTNFTSDNTYFFQIKVMDAISESALSSVFNLTLDTGLPTLTANCTNNTFTRVNLTCLFSIEDAFPYNLSVLVNRNGNDYHIKTNSTTVGRFINITFLLNLTEDGNYTIYINASDADKSSPRIEDDYSKGKKGESELVFNNTDVGNSVSMKIYFVEKDDKLTDTPATLKSFSEFNAKGTHIDFGVNFTVVKPETKIVFNLSINKGSFDVKEKSQTRGHINIIFFPNAIDFEGKLLINGVETNYTANITAINSRNVEVKIIPSVLLAGNDVVVFISNSVYGLNTIDIFQRFVNDRTSPTFVSAFNRTADSSNSTSITTATNANITIFGLDDLYLSTGNFSHNASGSWTNHSMSIAGNQTPYHYIIGKGNFTANQVVGWKFYVYDIAGNQLDPIYTFVVNSPPATATASASSTGASGGTAGNVPACGNNICEGSENQENCQSDCGLLQEQSTIDEGITKKVINTDNLLDKIINSDFIQSTRAIGSKIRGSESLTTLEIGTIIAFVVIALFFIVLVIFLIYVIFPP